MSGETLKPLVIGCTDCTLREKQRSWVHLEKLTLKSLVIGCTDCILREKQRSWVDLEKMRGRS